MKPLLYYFQSIEFGFLKKITSKIFFYKPYFLVGALFFSNTMVWAQNRDTLLNLMLERLNPSGKNPVHSIQIYISNKDRVFHEAVGFSDGDKIASTKEDQFKIASITKMMTAIVILQLQEEGKLKITDPIAQYLSNSKISRVSDVHFFEGETFGNQITIEQLLTHRSGLADLFTDSAIRFYLGEYLNKQKQWSAEKLMATYFKYGLNKKAHFVPGTDYYYSDVNYFLLGILIEEISGQSLAQQFRNRIFEPLAMQSTYFEYYEKPILSGNSANSFFGKRNITKTLNTSYDWAGGGVVSTTYDLALFLKGLFGLKLFTNPTTLKEMTTMSPHTLKSGRISNSGMGIFQYEFNGDLYFGHAGFWGTLIAYCPESNTVFCGNLNQVNPPFKTTDFIESLIFNF
jgi:D-alanyl-D-alanine carboxypeptidase